MKRHILFIILSIILLCFSGCENEADNFRFNNIVSEIQENEEQDIMVYNTEEQFFEMKYIGNTKTKKFHQMDCHTLPLEENRVYFYSRKEAVRKGFVACMNCNP